VKIDRDLKETVTEQELPFSSLQAPTVLLLAELKSFFIKKY
jgi:hypothetical protein